MVLINSIDISPPLINSSCAWSSDLEQLTELYESPYTGAVTTRTAVLEGFEEDAGHAVAFDKDSISSVNSYGYSPHPLSQYLTWVEEILTSHKESTKPIIISITAEEPSKLKEMLEQIQELRTKLLDNQAPPGKSRLAVEFNASCPNITGTIIPGYAPTQSLFPLLLMVVEAFTNDHSLTFGVKLPPYVQASQFSDLLYVMGVLAFEVDGTKRSPVSFLTSTNTLGNALLFSSQTIPNTEDGEEEEEDEEDEGDGEDGDASDKSGATQEADPLPDVRQFAVPAPLGGLAGEGIHPIALGNIYSLRQTIGMKYMLGTGLGSLKLIGVGGVTSKAAVERMKKAGADVVGCATLLGREGVRAFEILGKE